MSEDVSVFRLYDVHELGSDGYPVAWHTTIKHLVREQAGNRCARCGHPYAPKAGEWSPCDDVCFANDRHPFGWPLTRSRYEYDGESGEGIEIHEAAWRILTTHHLTGDKADCRWWNLAPLCQRDHLYIQGRVVMDQVFPFEHSAWFKPFAAGFYAARYLNEDLTREQALARMDELLALECAA